MNLDEKYVQEKGDESEKKSNRFYSTSAPASTNSLLGNFEVRFLGHWVMVLISCLNVMCAQYFVSLKLVHVSFIKQTCRMNL